ncbi:testis-expressed protein 44 [Psammomys obesus]|uniref:testis-expressed protein 44 n=1 Tax=Psammomys obesus TaxID=48139 RepID=UPI0024529A7F|nr:testis-expressed protein 44 [Psammomys obesus]
MTTEPLGEAKANNRPAHDLSEAALNNHASENSTDLPGESETPGILPDDGLPLDLTAKLSEEEDVDRASVAATIATEQDDDDPVSDPTAAFMGQDDDQAISIEQDVEPVSPMPTPRDREESPDAPRRPQESPEEEEITSLLSQDPGMLQMFVGFQNPVWDRLAENNRASWSRTVSPSDSQSQEKTPGKPEMATNAEAPPVLPDSVQTSTEDPDPPTLDISGPDQQPTSSTKSVEQEAEGLEALNPESKDISPEQTDSRIPQTPLSPGSPAGSVPPSPEPSQEALGRSRLDPSLYRPNVENDYMRSMTSLLGGGEGSISSLTDILVWSDTARGMGMALGFLTLGRSSPAERLQDEGPSLRTVSSLLGHARSAFSSGLAAGTGSALRSVSHLLESVERRTVEGIRSTVRYLANHLTQRWARTSPSSD